MTVTIAKPEDIEKINVADKAKHQIKELFRVCSALDGEFIVSSPSPANPDFANVMCKAAKPTQFDEVRLSGRRIELIGEKWLKTEMARVGEEPPAIVLRLTGEPIKVRGAYLDNEAGTDSIEGELKVKGLFGYVERDGKYINMELWMV